MTRVHPSKAIVLWLVMILTVVWTPHVLLAQGEDATDDLLEQMALLVEKSGTAGNSNTLQNLLPLLGSPEFQSALKNILAAGDLDGSETQASASGSNRMLLGLLPFSFVGMVVLVYAANLLLARILFAVNVFVNARRLVSDKTPPLFMGPALWAFAVVIGGMLVVALYWLMHHSTLSKLQQGGQAVAVGVAPDLRPRIG